MVIVHAFEPAPWNESAPGAPWGGQSTIWDACRDLMLAEKGRYDQPNHLKATRLHFELPQHSEQPGIKEPPRSATLRRMPQWPAPTFDSAAYKTLQMKLPPEPIPPLPSAHGRLDGQGEGPKAGVGPGPEEVEENLELPLELKWPGVRRVAWAVPGDKEFGARENSASPRYAPLRYGAAIVRQQRVSRARSALQHSASQTPPSSQQPSQQPSQPSHLPSQPASQLHSMSQSGSKNSRSGSGSGRSGPKGSGSRTSRSSKEMEYPPLELIPPFVVTQARQARQASNQHSARGALGEAVCSRDLV